MSDVSDREHLALVGPQPWQTAADIRDDPMLGQAMRYLDLSRFGSASLNGVIAIKEMNHGNDTH